MLEATERDMVQLQKKLPSINLQQLPAIVKEQVCFNIDKWNTMSVRFKGPILNWLPEGTPLTDGYTRDGPAVNAAIQGVRGGARRAADAARAARARRVAAGGRPLRARGGARRGARAAAGRRRGRPRAGGAAAAGAARGMAGACGLGGRAAAVAAAAV